MSKVFERNSAGTVDFNMTPMIDVTFQLILFFILAGSFASEVLAKIEVPTPNVSQAREEDAGTSVEKIIINVVSAATVEEEEPDPYKAGQLKHYQIDSTVINRSGAEETIQKAIRTAALNVPVERRKDFFVEIRADRRVYYSAVGLVMRAAVAAGVPNMRFAAILVTTRK